MNNIIQLLNEVKAIKERYEEISKRTGENFNIFKILNLQANEVRLHSTFLAELLKPNGTHGQGPIFLKLFKDTVIDEFHDNWEFDYESVTVKTESYAGKISKDSQEGGRLDLFLTDKNKRSIIIENKIYAANQENQLIRYHKHDEKALLLYLNLNGKVEKNFHEKVAPNLKEGEDYFIISYREHIVKWLDLCLKETVLLPNVRETLSQYIQIIKVLTNLSTSNAMNSEIMELIVSKPELFVSIEQMLKSYKSLRKKIRKNIFDELDKRLTTDEFKTQLKNINYQLILTADESEKYGFIFSYRIIKKELNYRTRLWEKDKGRSNKNRFFFNALVQKKENEKVFNTLSEHIKKHFPYSKSSNSSLILFNPLKFKGEKFIKDLEASEYLNLYYEEFCTLFVNSLISEIQTEDERLRKEILELEL